MKHKQRGYYMVGPTGGELVGCLGVVAAVLIGFGVFIGWLVPKVWGLVKPWIHAVTA